MFCLARVTLCSVERPSLVKAAVPPRSVLAEGARAAGAFFDSPVPIIKAGTSPRID